ncbi:hypothetical protein DL240_10180 [Lujinxingia litoralis]|uniref:Uncharacterized protein n=1 Tax=Lujinxingia litoralis TaxID=2211119 RepID=A0A328C4G1_9DELT|nr:hypothetical protein [Lujinxingia litoralis]RAL22211.1 hypothetical protein DL240_10180 [Lujinxingia litoralis]
MSVEACAAGITEGHEFQGVRCTSRVNKVEPVPVSAFLLIAAQHDGVVFLTAGVQVAIARKDKRGVALEEDRDARFDDERAAFYAQVIADLEQVFRTRVPPAEMSALNRVSQLAGS